MPPRSKPLKAKTPLRSTKRINPVSSRRRERDAVYAERRRRVYERAGGQCEARQHDGRNELLDGRARCPAPMVDVHHKAGRLGPEPHRLSNLVGLCRRHHDRAHADPRWALDAGLSVKRHGKGAA